MHQYHHHHRQQQQQQQQHAIVPYDPNGATREVLAIMKAVVSKKSEKKYRNENITFLLWVYDSDIMIKDMLLEEWFIAKLEDAEAGDRLRGKATRPAMREVCRDCLDAVNKEAKNCPLILPSLTFNLFSHYLTTQKKKSNNNTMLSRTAYTMG